MINTVTKEYHEKNFIGYQVVYENNEKWFVPLDESNTDYQAIQEWAKIEGNNIIDPGA
jgi:hypothetical protein